MDLFVIEGDLVTVTPQALNIKQFKDIWELHENKSDSIVWLSYVEFMCSLKKTNPFVGYLDPMERSRKILDSLPQGVEIGVGHPLITAGINAYNEHQRKGSPTAVFYESTLKAAHKLIGFFNSFDINKKNLKTGAPIYKPSDITRALNDTSNVIKTLTSMRTKVYSELAESSTGKAGRDINYFEDPSNN